MERTLVLALALIVMGLAGCRQRTAVMIQEHSVEGCDRCAHFDPAREALAQITIEELMATLPRVTDTEALPQARRVIPFRRSGVAFKRRGAVNEVGDECPSCMPFPRTFDIGMDLPRFSLIADNEQRYWIRMTEGFAGGISWHGPFTVGACGQIHVVCANEDERESPGMAFPGL